ncbi:unnamed protein product [Prorocentrum cordatum]|uniref:PDZ domain-containing protein n=1 Tax=Prorocentrum cordatum TaxID=2364126 RepID=A0ABN9V0H3_9DINO|nr:unnamed protein product [Polarella glacialis]
MATHWRPALRHVAEDACGISSDAPSKHANVDWLRLRRPGNGSVAAAEAVAASKHQTTNSAERPEDERGIAAAEPKGWPAAFASPRGFLNSGCDLGGSRSDQGANAPWPLCQSAPSALAGWHPGTFTADMPPGYELSPLYGTSFHHLSQAPPPWSPGGEAWVGCGYSRVDAPPPRAPGRARAAAVGAEREAMAMAAAGRGAVGGAAASREVSVTMQPGPLHMRMTTAGRVTRVAAGGQAAAHGVQPGWLLVSVDGKPYHEPLLHSKIACGSPYRVVFSAQEGAISAILAARAAFLEQQALRGGAAEQGAAGQAQHSAAAPSVNPDAPVPLRGPTAVSITDGCVIDVDGQTVLAADIAALQQQLQAESDQTPSPEAQQARASSGGGGASADAAPDPPAQERPAVREPGREAQRHYQTQRKKQQRIMKKKIRRGEVVVGPSGVLEPASAVGAPPAPQPASGGPAGEPGGEREPDGEQVPAEGTSSRLAPACDLIPGTRWFDGRRFGEDGAEDSDGFSA